MFGTHSLRASRFPVDPYHRVLVLIEERLQLLECVEQRLHVIIRRPHVIFEQPQVAPKGWRAGCPEYFIARLAAWVPKHASI